MPKVVQELSMAVSADALRRAILDFEKYPEFLSEVVAAKAHEKKSDGTQRVDFEIEVIKRFKYTLEFDASDKNSIKWRLIDSNFFTANEGSWDLTESGEKKTDVVYSLEVGVKFLVPGFIAKKLTEVSLPKLLVNFEARAGKLKR
jgi:ribosome-associated toxin RatA of RatAB toxin-antitoxin module